MVPAQEQPLSEVSLWVLEKMEEVSTFMGLLFDGVEEQAWEFFSVLERARSIRGLQCQGPRVHREVKNLKYGVNYDKWGGSVGRGGYHSLCGFV